jgi:hypothetical protein
MFIALVEALFFTEWGQAVMRLFCRLRSAFFLVSAVLYAIVAAHPLISQTADSNPLVEHLTRPEFGFYAKEINCDGVVIRGSALVRDQTLTAVCGRLDRMLVKQDLTRRNMMQRGVELHVVSAGEETSSLPESRGVDQFNGQQLDTGVYGSCSESRHAGDDMLDQCTRQLAISILLYGFDEQIRKHVEEQFRSAKVKGLWNESAAGSSPLEYWAQLSAKYFGRGEGSAPDLRVYDSGGYALLEHIYGGLERPIAVEVIRARSVSKLAISKVNGIHAQIQLVNNSPKPIHISWMDADGKIRAMGELGPYNRAVKDTFLSQVWIVEDQRGVELDRFIVENFVSEYIAAD